ncbi:AAA family ATPase [Glaciecola sp. SC05]|uniref:AAA family ATPase n=1 Tax=Glaciecola sp. SC05 TaxID=1987355 RepID=UPI0035294E63
MKLLSITLDGEYKGLRSDTFDFSGSQGRLLAFIGLNGSGKSQLFELIGETFSYLERYMRKDFKVKSSLGFQVSVVYSIFSEDGMSMFNYPLDLIPGLDEPDEQTLKIDILHSGQVTLSVKKGDTWKPIPVEGYQFPIPRLVGYSSGLNENLQRSFMKTAVQFFDVMRIRGNRRKELAGNVDETEVANINKRYLQRNKHIFSAPEDYDEDLNNLHLLKESDTPIPRNLFMDYDCCALLMVAFSILPSAEIGSILTEVHHNTPTLIKLRYSLNAGIVGEDSIRDIKLLIRAGGDDCVEGIGQRTSDEQFDLYELDFLEGIISLDMRREDVRERLFDLNYGEPLRLFERLYKLQLLGVKNWGGNNLKKLRQTNFFETVKKPLKTKLPLSVERLELSDQQGSCINFDDLSDGEAQLIQILAAARIFRDEQALFIMDEPETHLNPSWRTYFHQHLATANEVDEAWTDCSQTILSTHSPFMISSLRKTEVYRFERNDNGLITMNQVENQTYGASFDVLIREYFDLQSLISQTVVEDIKAHLPKNNSPDEHRAAVTWITENIGESMEKAYLLRKLQN